MMDKINGFEPVLSFMGTRIALSKLNTDPTADDILGEVEGISGFSIDVGSVDTTSVSSTTGMSRQTPTYKSWGNMTVNLFKNNSNFKRVFDQFFGYNTSEEGFYCDLTLVWPKLPGWSDVYNIKLHGYMSGFSLNDITRDDVQKVSFNFQPSGNPEIFAGFSNITSLTANPVELAAEGGNVSFTVVGTELVDGLLIKGFVNNVADPLTITYTSGSSVSQTATIKYPPNAGTEDKVYTVKVSTDGGVTYSDKTATVTIKGSGG